MVGLACGNRSVTAWAARLGSMLLESLKSSYETDIILHQPTQRVYVLRQTEMPAVLLECGYLDNPADLAFIRNSQNQEKVARDILLGLRRYQQNRAAR